jgi:hypothetical protein
MMSILLNVMDVDVWYWRHWAVVVVVGLIMKTIVDILLYIANLSLSDTSKRLSRRPIP